MPQLNSDDAANDEPTRYNVEESEDDRWNENLNDIKGALVDDLDSDTRGGSNNKSDNHGESSSKSQLERDDPRDEAKGPGRPYLYPPDIGSIVSSLPPSFFQNGGLPPNGKVPYPYHPYHHLLYGRSGDLDSKSAISRSHPDIPAMYSLPGQLGQIPHPLAPWPAPTMYPMCTASTIAPMLRYHNPFAAAFSSAAAVAASNMPRFPHGPGMHPTMIPHPALVSNGPLSNMGNGQHPHHGKHDDKGGRHSKSESEHHGGGRSKRDRPYVKKPLNAFMLYMKEQRAKVVAECTLKESAAINQILGRKWHSLSREEQQKYYEMARKERQLHLQMYPGWSARDNYGKRKKRKKEKSQGECTAQNPKKCRAVFGLEQQQLWCAPCRRKKKCVRYQHGDDSDDDDDLSPLSSPQQYQGYSGHNPFDCMRSTSPLSMTSQSIPSANGSGEFHSSSGPAPRLPGEHVSPHNNHPVNIPENIDIKQEYRTSPAGVEGRSNMTNGVNNFENVNGRHHGRNSSSENSFKSDGSPQSQGGDSNSSSHGNHHHGSNDNTNNNNQKEHRQNNFGRSAPPQNIVHRQASAPTNGGDSRNNFRKTNSLDGSDVPSTSGLGGSRNHSRSHNTSSHSHTSDNSPGARTHHRSSFSKPSGSHGNMPPHPSPLHPQTSGLYLPGQAGASPLLPVSPPYNHAPGGPFMPPYSPYLPASMLAAFGTPSSPLGNPMLSLFKGISPSSMGGGMGGHNPVPSHGSQSRVAPSAVEGKS